MGFLNNLFKNKKGEVIVKFYEDDKVSVSYTPTSSKVKHIALNFLGYNQAMCDHLGEDLTPKGMIEELSRENPSPSMLLREVLNNIFENSLKKDQNVLEGEIHDITYSLNIIRDKMNYIVIYEGDFYGPEPPELKIPYNKNESFYGPMSVLAFLQHLINTLTQEEIDKFYQYTKSAMAGK